MQWFLVYPQGCKTIITKHFKQPKNPHKKQKTKKLDTFTRNSPFPPTIAPAITNLLSVSMNFLFQIFHINGIIKYRPYMSHYFH